MQKSSALQHFERQIQGMGHPDYPFLHKTYSPGSRVPCTDLIPFISDRLEAGDLTSIKYVMRGLLEANPGLGVRLERIEGQLKTEVGLASRTWIDARVENVARIDFRRYVCFRDNNAYHRLKALFIVAEKSGGRRQFWINDETPRLFSWSLCAFHPTWQEATTELLGRANSFIDEKAEKFDFWVDYPHFKQEDLELPDISTNQVIAKVRDLSPAAGLQLFYAASRLRPGEIWHERGGNTISDLTSYAIRSFGIDIPSTSSEILDSALVTHSRMPRALLHQKTKDELIKECNTTATHFRRSWTKAKILEALESQAPGYVRTELEQLDLVVLNSKYEAQLLALADYAEKLVVPFKLLCFI